MFGMQRHGSTYLSPMDIFRIGLSNVGVALCIITLSSPAVAVTSAPISDDAAAAQPSRSSFSNSQETADATRDLVDTGCEPGSTECA